MNEQNQDSKSTNAGQGTAAGKKAEKVRSSRYEWDKRSGEDDFPTKAGKAARGTLRTALLAWLRKLFSQQNAFFDNDDDATPSAA